MANKGEVSIVKRKIEAVDKLVRNKQKMEGRHNEMSLLLKATQKELEEANIVREETLEARRDVWKKEEEMKKMEENWRKRMKQKEEELEEKDKQILKLRSELAQEKKEKEEVQEELDIVKHTYVSIGDLLSRKRAGPTDLADGSS